MQFATVVRCVTVVTGGRRAIIVGFLSQNLTTMAVAVAFSMAWLEAEADSGNETDHASTRSGSSSKPWAGPRRNSANRPRPTGGPG